MVDERLTALRDEQMLRECGIDVPLVEAPERMDPDPGGENGELTPGECLLVYALFGVACWFLLVAFILLGKVLWR